MSNIGKLACASLVALCLSEQTQARERSDAEPIRIMCDDARLAAMCDEIALALLEAQSVRPVEVVDTRRPSGPAFLTLRFETARLTDTVVSGHLAWRDESGQSGAGTAIDLTVMDATIDDDMLREYARQLLIFSPLPLS